MSKLQRPRNKLPSGFVQPVPRPIHLAHAALTERFKDFVMTEGFADQAGDSLPGKVRRQPTWKLVRESTGRR